MARPKGSVDKKKNDKNKSTEIEKLYCRRCGNMKPSDKFYEATSTFLDSNGKMSICSNCCNEIYFDYFEIYHNIEKALQMTCQDLDICFHSDALRQAMSHIESLTSKGKKAEAVFGYYKSKLSSTAKNNGITKFRYQDSDLVKERDLDEEKCNINLDEYESIDIAMLKMKWGNLPPDDLTILQEKYNEWETGFELGGKNRELIVEQICFEELFIYKERQEGKDVSKRIKTIRELMSAGNLSPKQETASESAEFQTLAEFIKKVEQKKPFAQENYDDVDKMGKMWKCLAGAINRTQGKPDEYTQVFDEEYAPYTMDLGNVDSNEGV